MYIRVAGSQPRVSQGVRLRSAVGGARRQQDAQGPGVGQDVGRGARVCGDGAEGERAHHDTRGGAGGRKIKGAVSLSVVRSSRLAWWKESEGARERRG